LPLEDFAEEIRAAKERIEKRKKKKKKE